VFDIFQGVIVHLVTRCEMYFVVVSYCSFCFLAVLIVATEN